MNKIKYAPKRKAPNQIKIMKLLNSILKIRAGIIKHIVVAKQLPKKQEATGRETPMLVIESRFLASSKVFDFCLRRAWAAAIIQPHAPPHPRMTGLKISTTKPRPAGSTANRESYASRAASMAEMDSVTLQNTLFEMR